MLKSVIFVHEMCQIPHPFDATVPYALFHLATLTTGYGEWMNTKN